MTFSTTPTGELARPKTTTTWYYTPDLTTVAMDDPYWKNSERLAKQLDECFDVLIRRMLGTVTAVQEST